MIKCKGHVLNKTGEQICPWVTTSTALADITIRQWSLVHAALYLQFPLGRYKCRQHEYLTKKSGLF